MDIVKSKDRIKDLENDVMDKDNEINTMRLALNTNKEELNRAMQFQKTTISEFEALQVVVFSQYSQLIFLI